MLHSNSLLLSLLNSERNNVAAVCLHQTTTWFFCCMHEALLWVADRTPWNRMRQTDTDHPWGVWQSWVAPWRRCTAYWVSHDRSFLKGLVYLMVSKQESRTGAAASTSWLHSIHALFQHLPFLTLIESYEILFPSYFLFFFNLAAVFCLEWCQCKQTQTHQFPASRSQLLYWDKVTLMNCFLPLILTVRTYFCLTIYNSKTAIFYVSFCSQSYK